MKLIKKISLLSVLLCTLVTAFALNVKVRAAATVASSVDFTTKSYKHSAYIDSWEYGEWTISGGANNNGEWAFVKMGGNSKNLGNFSDIFMVSPKVTNVTDKVEVSVNEGSLPKGGMSATVSVYVYSDSTCTTKIDSTSAQTIKGNAEVLTFVPNAPLSTWPANSYFKVVFNVQNTTSTNGVVWVDKVAIYNPAGTATILIDGDTNAKIGKKLSLNAITNNTDSQIAWSVNEEAQATIENGTLTPVAMETVIVTAYLVDNPSVYDVITINVYPDNTDVITVADALDICEYVGENNTPFNYTIKGTVGDDVKYDADHSSYTFTLSNDTDKIKAYGVKGIEDVSKGDSIYVTGPLTTYMSYDDVNQVDVPTPEIKMGTYKYEYDVIYIVDETQYYVNTVLTGDNLDAPVAPKKENYEFVGWYNGNTEWNFENDIVVENLTLTAKFRSNSLDPIVNNLNAVKAYISMAYTYKVVPTNLTDTLDRQFTGATSSSYITWEKKKLVSPAVYAGVSAGGNSSIQLRSSDNTSGIVTTTSGGKIAQITVTWNSGTSIGRTLSVYGSNTAFTSSKELYGDNINGELLCDLTYDGNATTATYVFEGDYAYIGIRSKSGAQYLDKISIEWRDPSYASYQNVDFRFKCGVDATLESLPDCPDGVTYTYGVAVSTNAKTKYYAYEKLNTSEVGKLYQVISLGDVLNNVERLTEKFTVTAYIEIDGVKYYSTASKTYSISSIVDEYKSQGIAIDELDAILAKFGC